MKNFILFFVLILFSFQTKAGLYAEPLVNSLIGTCSQDIGIIFPVSGSAKAECKLSGFQYGGRLGYIWTNFNVGLQVSGANGKQKEGKITTSIGGTSIVATIGDSDFSRMDNGLVLGYKFGPMFRMWFSSLSASMTSKNSDGTKTKYKGITGLLGLGWNVASHVSINLELGGSIYSEEDGKAYPFTETVSGITMLANEYKETLVLIGVSFPFGLY